jgi:uncharacterized protein (TIGR00369 family)
MPDFVAANPEYRRWIETVFARQAFMRLIGARLVSIEPGACTIAVDHTADLEQQNGVIHGGVIGALADNAAGAAGGTLQPEGTATVTAEYKINFLAPAIGERIEARGRVLRAGRSLVVCQSEVYARREGRETLSAVALVTLTPSALKGSA